MREIILDKLNDIEKEQGVRILLAVESGSRAWGFASTDSDYDVRFIYARPMADYLKLEERRDVIELPAEALLDINGWDVRKTLRLLYKSNPTLFEWFSSPIVYRRDQDFCGRFLPVMGEYFSSRNGLWHYLSMAEGNYRDYLKDQEVRAKKYFYVLRPILACRWILEYASPPPMLFSELAASQLPEYLRPQVDWLLELKMTSPETRLIPRIVQINDYLDHSIMEIKERIKALPQEAARDWRALDELFLFTLANTPEQEDKI